MRRLGSQASRRAGEGIGVGLGELRARKAGSQSRREKSGCKRRCGAGPGSGGIFQFAELHRIVTTGLPELAEVHLCSLGCLFKVTFFPNIVNM